MISRSVIALLAAFVLTTSSAAAAEPPPNILFIYTDDQSHRTVGCYPESYPFVRTPNIDQLAAAGVRFEHAFIGTWCMPSRATLLTGHYQHGIESMRMEGDYPGSAYDPALCPFWPRVFREQGYQTAQIGKWHTGTDTGFGRDWDYQIVWNRPRHTANAGNYYKDQLIEFQGGEARLVSGYSTDNYTDWAVDYLKGNGRDASKPFYLWLCYGAVHGPFTPADRHLDAYPEVEVPIPADIYPPRPGKPAYMQNSGVWFEGEDGRPHLKSSRRATGEDSPSRGRHGSDLNSWIRQYHQGVLAIDEAVGRLIETLRLTGLYENTLIVFTSDQGFAWGQHGFRAKTAPYDANIRSPLIISMPARIPSGTVCSTPAGGVDLVPTFFDYANLELPWEMHGRSLRPLLENPSQGWDRPLLNVFTGNRYGSDADAIPTDPAILTKVASIPWYVSLHDGRYKYIRTLVEGEIEELYDLENDPEELTNLALHPEDRARVDAMRAGTLEELRRTGAGFVENLPSVSSSSQP